MKQKTSYSEKLKNPSWQRKRLEILDRDEFMCKMCHNEEETLHVHHRLYIPNTDPWDYPNELLVTLCEKCHEKESRDMKAAFDKFVHVIRSKFFAADLLELANAFEKIEFSYDSFVFAEALNHVLSDPKKVYKIEDEYAMGVSQGIIPRAK
jgi:hypothetical protein